MFDFLLSRKIKHKFLIGNEVHAARLLGMKHHIDDNTILLEDGSLMQVIQVDGFPFETADDEELEVHKQIRNSLLRGIATSEFSLSIHLVRRKQDILQDGFGSRKLRLTFADYVNRTWNHKISSKKSYVNKWYISVIRKTKKQGLIFAVGALIKTVTQGVSDKAWEMDTKDALSQLKDITKRIVATFRSMNARILEMKEVNGNLISEPMTFLTEIVNIGVSQPVLATYEDIAHYIPQQRLCFKDRLIEVRTHDRKLYAGIVSLKEYGQSTSAGMLDRFLQLPIEFTMTQSFAFQDRRLAIARMSLQQKRMIASEDKAVSEVISIGKALDDATSGRIGFGTHHLTVMCYQDDRRSLENTLAMVATELSNCGLYTMRETVNLEAAYWAQVPGNDQFIARKATINTMNLSGFASMHNYPIGKKTGNHWGEAITVMETASGTPYYFNFHVRDIGHTTIIGPTGAGKTTIMGFLLAQSLKVPNLKLFIFDKDFGMKIFVKAVGGKHSTLDSRSKSGFNPCQLPDTTENRNFLTQWMSELAKAQTKERLSAEEIQMINRAVEGNYKLKHADRRLANIASFFGIGGPDSLSGRMQMWHSGGSYSAIFDNEIDEVDFSKNSVFGFEMGQIIGDDICMIPVLFYIFHRIYCSLKGDPALVVLDEAWALIDNDFFAPMLKNWLKTFRKLNAAVICATQSVEDASKSQISDTLIQQSATQIFLPNMKATDVYKAVFMLSNREFDCVKHSDPSSRFFLVKQETRAVVARVDLSGMNDIINILSGRAETVQILDEICEEVGDDPAAWLDRFKMAINNV